MPSAEQTVLQYLHAVLDRDVDPYTGQALEGILNDAARDAEHVFAVTCGDKSPALLTLGDDGAALFRLHDDDTLEKLSFGPLANGLVSEEPRVPAHPGDDPSTIFTYSNPMLESVGGALTLELRYASAEEQEHVRAAFESMAGTAVSVQA